MIKANDRTTTEATISNGVVTITVATNTSEGDGVMRNAITSKLNSVFGVSSPTALANHVMYCLPHCILPNHQQYHQLRLQLNQLHLQLAAPTKSPTPAPTQNCLTLNKTQCQTLNKTQCQTYSYCSWSGRFKSCSFNTSSPVSSPVAEPTAEAPTGGPGPSQCVATGQPCPTDGNTCLLWLSIEGKEG